MTIPHDASEEELLAAKKLGDEATDILKRRLRTWKILDKTATREGYLLTCQNVVVAELSQQGYSFVYGTNNLTLTGGSLVQALIAADKILLYLGALPDPHPWPPAPPSP